ncbi:hypothetical protein A2368_00070 [Candidatus Collierbacteria bacterium RIFOXYB1_FULL_49_13]|uniref:Uncharacterized protein n=1 Tax=Candidatus Collierbacteria bacterium RIFOXYB1_FULL_49_13 TaxID=1817728 RepID=A0A1F5FIY2_9BACT|nr:MAG: hypothetical protein A2368_00070 [Candidatus Collierbacteria bacterium RIFOXYB1_FULL_49_13]
MRRELESETAPIENGADNAQRRNDPSDVIEATVVDDDAHSRVKSLNEGGDSDVPPRKEERKVSKEECIQAMDRLAGLDSPPAELNDDVKTVIEWVIQKRREDGVNGQADDLQGKYNQAKHEEGKADVLIKEVYDAVRSKSTAGGEKTPPRASGGGDAAGVPEGAPPAEPPLPPEDEAPEEDDGGGDDELPPEVERIFRVTEGNNVLRCDSLRNWFLSNVTTADEDTLARVNALILIYEEPARVFPPVDVRPPFAGVSTSLEGEMSVEVADLRDEYVKKMVEYLYTQAGSIELPQMKDIDALLKPFKDQISDREVKDRFGQWGVSFAQLMLVMRGGVYFQEMITAQGAAQSKPSDAEHQWDVLWDRVFKNNVKDEHFLGLLKGIERGGAESGFRLDRVSAMVDRLVKMGELAGKTDGPQAVAEVTLDAMGNEGGWIKEYRGGNKSPATFTKENVERLRLELGLSASEAWSAQLLFSLLFEAEFNSRHPQYILTHTRQATENLSKIAWWSKWWHRRPLLPTPDGRLVPDRLVIDRDDPIKDAHRVTALGREVTFSAMPDRLWSAPGFAKDELRWAAGLTRREPDLSGYTGGASVAEVLKWKLEGNEGTPKAGGYLGKVMGDYVTVTTLFKTITEISGGAKKEDLLTGQNLLKLRNQLSAAVSGGHISEERARVFMERAVRVQVLELSVFTENAVSMDGKSPRAADPYEMLKMFSMSVANIDSAGRNLFRVNGEEGDITAEEIAAYNRAKNFCMDVATAYTKSKPFMANFVLSVPGYINAVRRSLSAYPDVPKLFRIENLNNVRMGAVTRRVAEWDTRTQEMNENLADKIPDWGPLKLLKWFIRG